MREVISAPNRARLPKKSKKNKIKNTTHSFKKSAFMAIHTDNKSNYWYWYNNISMEISEKTTSREGKKRKITF